MVTYTGAGSWASTEKGSTSSRRCRAFQAAAMRSSSGGVLAEQVGGQVIAVPLEQGAAQVALQFQTAGSADPG